MAMNRIQFQQGMSLFEHFQHFGTEAQCAAALKRTHLPTDFAVRTAAGPRIACRAAAPARPPNATPVIIRPR